MPVHGAGGASDGVQRPCRFQARDDAGGIGDVDANVPRLRSSRYDVVALRQFGRNRAPQHSARADEENAKSLRLRHQLALPLNSMGAWRGRYNLELRAGPSQPGGEVEGVA